MWFSKRTSANSAAQSPDAAQATPKPATALANVIEQVADPTAGDSAFRLPFLTGLFNLGQERAIKAGIVTLTEEFLKPLEDHARSIARENYRVAFNPDEHFHDGLDHAEYERARQLREEARNGEDHAVSRLRRAHTDLDATRKVGDRPKPPRILLLVAVAMVGVSLAATVHDRLLPDGMDSGLSIVLSILIGAMIGAAPIYVIFHSRNSVGRKLGLIGGFLLAVGLFAVRVAGAETASDYVYACGWSLLEIAGVLLAEFLSKAFYKAEVDWEALHHTEAAARAAVESGEADVALWRERMATAQKEMDRISAIVHDRNSRSLRSDELEELCVSAVRDGANAGVAHNLGVVRGLQAPARA